MDTKLIERENIILGNEGERQVIIDCWPGGWLDRKLRKAGHVPTRTRDWELRYVIDRSRVVIRANPKPISDEERAQRRARFKSSVLTSGDKPLESPILPSVGQSPTSPTQEPTP
jgi:hypothetical protein